MRIDSNEWENLYLAAGSPERILLVGFKSEKLKPLTGKSLAEVAKMRGKDPIETIMDLLVEDESRIDTIYFLMSEENVTEWVASASVSPCSWTRDLQVEKAIAWPRAAVVRRRLLPRRFRPAMSVSRLSPPSPLRLRRRRRCWLPLSICITKCPILRESSGRASG